MCGLRLKASPTSMNQARREKLALYYNGKLPASNINQKIFALHPAAQVR
jgi:hypothetical protein